MSYDKGSLARILKKVFEHTHAETAVLRREGGRILSGSGTVI